MNTIAAPGKVILFGAGALAREMLQVMADLTVTGKEAHCVAVCVDAPYAAAASALGVPVVSDIAMELRADPHVRVVIALGDPAARATIARRIEAEAGDRFATLVHPLVWLGATVTVGAGSMLFGHVSATTHVTIGHHVLVNPGCTLAHDVVLEDFATLAPSVALAGNVHVGQGADLGTGAAIIPKCRVGAGAIVGAGSVVIRDVAPGTTVAGVPARPLAR